MFVTNDMIGRNGHQRWPEALEIVNQYWHELPEAYRYNKLLSRYEPEYMNWDCSTEGFEGIRAQDILPDSVLSSGVNSWVRWCADYGRSVVDVRTSSMDFCVK